MLNFWPLTPNTSVNYAATGSQTLSTGNQGHYLKAITIYKSDIKFDIKDICALVDKCDLKFFHLEDSCEPKCMEFEHVQLLLRSLANKKSLESLALVMPDLSQVFGTVVGKGSPWPHLKLLHLGPTILSPANQDWMTRLPELTNSAILTLPSINPLLSAVARNSGLKDRLRSLHIELFDFDDVEALLDVLPGCNILQYLGASELSDCQPSMQFTDVIRRFLRLPCLETFSTK
ncbi:hypothetical protein BDW74DRAFT_178840 [Aspergillus multicolor]|uniref:uncharacterized protein n=1 Tax=Aspergillus multicolor TaxID=41759 RepID=UPI003CCCA203